MGSWNARLSAKTRCCSNLWSKPVQPKQFLFRTIGREAAAVVPWREVDKARRINPNHSSYLPFSSLPGSNQRVLTELKLCKKH